MGMNALHEHTKRSSRARATHVPSLYDRSAGQVSSGSLPQSGLPRQDPVDKGAPSARRQASNKSILARSTVLALLVAIGIAGYAYWTGYIGDRSGSTQQMINAELAERGFSDVRVAVKNQSASAFGSLASRADKDQVLATIRAHKHIKHVFDAIEVQSTSAQSDQTQAKTAPPLHSESAPRPAISDEPPTQPLPPPSVSGQTNSAPPSSQSEPASAEAGPPPVPESHPKLPAEPPAVRPTTKTLPPSAKSVPRKPKRASVAEQQPGAPQINTIQEELNKGLAQSGFNEIRAKVIDRQTVVLTGTAKSAEEKAAAAEYVSSSTGMSVGNNVQVDAPDAAPLPDPAKVEGEINRALRESGLSGVTAQIENDFSATLRGATRNLDEKEKAFAITARFTAIGRVRDQIFVVEQ